MLGFNWRKSDNKSFRVYWTLLSILANLDHTVICIVTIVRLISNFVNLCSKHTNYYLYHHHTIIIIIIINFHFYLLDLVAFYRNEADYFLDNKQHRVSKTLKERINSMKNIRSTFISIFVLYIYI